MAKSKNKKPDLFDSHVEVIGFGRGRANAKAKQIIKQKVLKDLSKRNASQVKTN